MAQVEANKKDKPRSEKREKKSVSEESLKPKSGIWQDERFQHLVSDPRFRSLPKQQRKVKIDKRFQGMFTNDKFKVKYTVDKYGRRVNKSNVEDLRKFYELDSSDEETGEEVKVEKNKSADDKSWANSSEEDEDERRNEEKAITQQASDLDENDDLLSDDEDVPTSLRERLVDPYIDYARGEGRLITDSSSDDESSENEDIEMYIDHVWGDLANDAETTEESTKRLAVCNMDWDRVRAVDLMVLFSSFLPPGGSVLSVKIYLSEFGRERLKEEELHGPPELVGLSKEAFKENGQLAMKNKEAVSADSDSDDELVQEQDSDAGEGDEYHMEKLRQYQLNRLRYYYAVFECDSVATADKIYQECDGLEFESSATKVDLRFIPDDTSFDEVEPIDFCNELPDASSYQPRQFTTTALHQAKVDLTWDETAVDRKELGDKLSAGKLEGISEQDLRKIVAYSSEEEQSEEGENEENEDSKIKKLNAKESKKEDKSDSNTEMEKSKKKSKKKDEVINKYKALLAEINEQEESQKQKKKYEMEFSWELENDKPDISANDNEMNNDKNTNANLTPIEKVLQKRAEKNKKRKIERKKKKLQAMGQDSESELDSIPDDIDMDDPYFAEEFDNGDFVDPKTKRKERKKKQKRLKEEQEEEDEKQTKELELLLDNFDEEDTKQHFSLDKILKSEQETKTKKKRRKQLKKSKNAIQESQKPVEDNFQLNMNDQRFNAVFTSHEYNIDPTDSHFKKTKAMEQLIHEKLKRRHDDEKNDYNVEMKESVNKKPKKHLENTMLVKSLKRKIQMKQQNK